MGGGAYLAKIAIIAPLPFFWFFKYIIVMHLKRMRIPYRIEIQTEKEWLSNENFEKNQIFTFALAHIGALCTKTLYS